MKMLLKCFIVVAIVATGMVNGVSAKNGNLQVRDTVIPDSTKQEMLYTSNLHVQEDVVWTKVEVADLPETVAKAVNEKYEGYAIEEAYQGDNEQYKLIIKKDESKLIVIFDKDGNFVQEVEE